jgi:F0F1-type ATP synthase membrane subunit c/vacuolar-type H+-ATPase subunit K
MPTDLDEVAARKREAQAQAQTKIMVLFWLIVCLGMIGPLFQILGH